MTNKKNKFEKEYYDFQEGFYYISDEDNFYYGGSYRVNEEGKNEYEFYIRGYYGEYTLFLSSKKLTSSIIEKRISKRDRKMIENIGYWIEDVKVPHNKLNFTNDKLYIYIRLKALSNPEFLEWWNDYNFKL